MEEYQFTIDVTKLLSVLERIAVAIEEQTQKLHEIDWTIGQISDRLEISPKGKAEAEGLNITDILSFCDNREELGSIMTNTREIARQISRIAEGGNAE